MAAGICGQNMNLAAISLGVGACWVGFSGFIESVPPLKEKLGLTDPWKITTAMVLGYPKFKQEGIVPREFRPITWFREGAEGPEVEE
jgi:nitroreductase